MSPAARSESVGAELDRRRLVWRCRRGMKELDVLLEHYVRTQGQTCAADRLAFEQLLELPDPLLAGYLLGHDTPQDPELARLVRQINCGAPATGEGS